MRAKIQFLVMLLVMTVMTVPAHAILLGDAVEFGHYFDDQISPYGENPGFRTIQSGSADSWSYFGLYTVNPQDTSFLIDFSSTGTWSPGNTFNGLKISGIDAAIPSVNIDTNLAGWDDSRLTKKNGELDLNWSGLSWKDDTYLNAHLETVPEPATVFLLGSGLLMGFRHARKKIVGR